MYINLQGLSFADRQKQIRSELQTLQVPCLETPEQLPVGQVNFTDGQLLTLSRGLAYYELRSWMPLQAEVVIEILQLDHRFILPNGEQQQWHADRIRRIYQSHPPGQLPGIRLFYCYHLEPTERLLDMFGRWHHEQQPSRFNREDLINLQMLSEELC